MITIDELLFFDSHRDALALYESFREAVLTKVPDARIEVKKTQISFFDRRYHLVRFGRQKIDRSHF